MKKLLVTLLVLIMTLITACGPVSTSQGSSTPKGDGTTPIKIGVVQLIEHDALDQAYQGFVDGLAQLGYVDGENIVIDFQNAQGEQSNCVAIADKLVNNRSDLILAIATPAAQAVANRTRDIPILVTAVTDPADAKLVNSNELPGGNVTGTSDLNPIAEQMGLLLQLVPKTKTVGMLYCSSEDNSALQVSLARAELEAKGITCIDYTVSNSNEIQQVVQSMVGRVDVVYAPADNMIAAGMATVNMVTEPAKLPVIVAEGGMVRNGGLATYGLSYYNLGKQTAAMAARILKGEVQPATMPIEYLEQMDLIINKASADAMGIIIPQELLNKAQLVGENG